MFSLQVLIRNEVLAKAYFSFSAVSAFSADLSAVNS